jgi:hypothetical protein
MASEDRLTLLLSQSAVTGIDFVQVVDPSDQTLLRIFYLIDPDTLNDPNNPSRSDLPIVNTGDLPVDVSTKVVSIVSISGGESLAQVPVVRATYLQVPLDEVPLDGRMRTVLEIETAEPGDFSIYRLTLLTPEGMFDSRIDRFFNGVEFSFKQGCPSVLDCKQPELECPPEEWMDFPVDYLARDFTSIRNALLDFAAQRYPQWTEKIEADAGVMLAEIMAALGDELSYIQDRYAREAYLETATQRRSLHHHTKLIDYPIHEGLTASTFLSLTVSEDKNGNPIGTFVNAGSLVWAPSQGENPIPFELGNGLADTTADKGNPTQFWVHSSWNEIPVHVPDDSQPCLPVGTTEVFLPGHYPIPRQVPPGEDPLQFWLNKWLLLETLPKNSSIPIRRHLVRIVEVEQTTDPLSLDNSEPPQITATNITRLKWEEKQALPFEICLHDLVVRGNLVFATAGETIVENFGIRSNQTVAQAIERQGPLNDIACKRSETFLYSLKQTETQGLGWLGELREASPELELQEVNPLTLQPLDPPQIWGWRRTLLDTRGFEDVFTLENGTWRSIISFRRMGETITHADYASGFGFTIRFGDGEFGRIPDDGTVFQVRYHTGPGTKANLPADTIVNLTHPVTGVNSALRGMIAAVTNPFPVTNGVNPEDAAVVKQLAPDAFRAITFRAVRPEDYAEIAERLAWVQRAGARFRWTGSWLSAFVTADPAGAFELSPERRMELTNLMDGVRQAGREVFVRNPRYVNLDLQIRICIQPFAYPGQVKARVLEALVGRKGVRPIPGFFHPDNFTFGTPLQRSKLEAVIQAVSGVLSVEKMRIRVRGIRDWQDFDTLTFMVGSDQIIRLQNDPRFPERGSVRIYVRHEQQEAFEEDWT